MVFGTTAVQSVPDIYICQRLGMFSCLHQYTTHLYVEWPLRVLRGPRRGEKTMHTSRQSIQVHTCCAALGRVARFSRSRDQGHEAVSIVSPYQLEEDEQVRELFVTCMRRTGALAQCKCSCECKAPSLLFLEEKRR